MKAPDEILSRVDRDYDSARRKAFWNGLFSFFRGKPNNLIAYEDVRRHLKVKSQSYAGLRTVPIANIVGSVGRYRDFDGQFLPRQDKNEGKWKAVDSTYYNGVPLPPIQLYKIGEVYFVIDGNHRVSVAREQGGEFIDAEVYELDIGVPFDPRDTEPTEAILEAEYRQFLQETALDRLRPEHRIRFSTHGRYARLLHHIQVHQYYMGLERDQAVCWEEAVTNWYDTIYLPLSLIIRDSQILEDFPGRTEGDLYIWIMNHRYYLNEEAGRDVGPEHAALDFASKFAPRAARRAEKSRIQNAKFRMQNSDAEGG